ncbi:hypothetical protein GAYE_SCF02G2143 [Galdieria yellowstonensis]|uniref:Membrane insertase YidC/Oxa/ALB C-terminal domain-containing protein n=1 Tax=Galdieria yellowstonensis TaxID=3028027 RepID=A0AAV9IA15_9RHOD|nr:hypothetical protein GAYE_SCF02G2143 [Galdieria yellowstonensis]
MWKRFFLSSSHFDYYYYYSCYRWVPRQVSRAHGEGFQQKLSLSNLYRNMSTGSHTFSGKDSYHRHNLSSSIALLYGACQKSALTTSRCSNSVLFSAHIHYSNYIMDSAKSGDLTKRQDKSGANMTDGGKTQDSEATATSHLSDVSTTDLGTTTTMDETVASSVGSSSSSSSSSWYDPVISYLTYLHDTTNMPWWALIVSCTIAVRFIMLPFTLLAMRNAAIMNTIQPRLKEIQDLMFDAKSRGKMDEARYYQQQYMKLIKENDINPFRSMLGPLVQTPVFLAFFFGLRKMAETVPSFKTGGTSWFEDLSKPDPLFLMPTLCAGIFLLNLQLSLMTGASPTNKQWINIFRVFGLSIIPLTAKMPCAIFCYWIPSNLFSFLQNLVFSITSVRALLRLPPLPYKRSQVESAVQANSATSRQNSASEQRDAARSTVPQNSVPSSMKKKTPLKLYDKAPKHRSFSVLLYQQTQLWTKSSKMNK